MSRGMRGGMPVSYTHLASDDVYEFLLCSICPVSLSKPGLYYNLEDNRIEERIRDWVVDLPDKGFLSCV